MVRFAVLRARTAFAIAVLVWAHPARSEPDKATCVAAYEAGQVLSRNGSLLDAREKLVMCAAAPCPSVLRPECVQWLGAVERRIPSIVVIARTPDGADVTEGRLFIDGRLVAPRIDGRAIDLDPGEHELRIEAPPSRGDDGEGRSKIVAAEGDKGRHVIVVVGHTAATRAPAAASSVAPTPMPARRIAPTPRASVPTGTWIALGTAGAGLVTFGAFTVLGESQYAELERCRPHCSARDVTTAQTLYATGDVALGVALVATGVAALAYLLTRPNPRAAAMSPTNIRF